MLVLLGLFVFNNYFAITFTGRDFEISEDLYGPRRLLGASNRVFEFDDYVIDFDVCDYYYKVVDGTFVVVPEQTGVKLNSITYNGAALAINGVTLYYNATGQDYVTMDVPPRCTNKQFDGLYVFNDLISWDELILYDYKVAFSTGYPQQSGGRTYAAAVPHVNPALVEKNQAISGDEYTVTLVNKDKPYTITAEIWFNDGVAEPIQRAQTFVITEDETKEVVFDTSTLLTGNVETSIYYSFVAPDGVLVGLFSENLPDFDPATGAPVVTTTTSVVSNTTNTTTTIDDNTTQDTTTTVDSDDDNVPNNGWPVWVYIIGGLGAAGLIGGVWWLSKGGKKGRKR